MLVRFDLATLADRHLQSLSGGQKQRLVIACGIIKDPEIFILDEPTSGLDRINMDAISKRIQVLAGREPVFLSSPMIWNSLRLPVLLFWNYR